MLSLFESGARFIRVFIELCVLVGILLLLYFLAEVIEFFPPSLTLGDAAKLALVSVVAASVNFASAFATLSFSSILVLAVLLLAKWVALLTKDRWALVSKIDSYFSKVTSSGFIQLLIVGLVLVWAFALDLLPYRPYSSKIWILIACSFAFVLLTTSYFEFPEKSDFDQASLRSYLSGEVPLSFQVFLVGLGIAVIAPVFTWGSFDTFVLITMTKAGLVQVPADLFIKQEYCGLVVAGFDGISNREGFCYLQDVAVMFHGIGDKVLVENFTNGYKVALPADSVFMASEGE